MHANYYYFVSSLPYLRPNTEPPLRSAAFLELCSYQLPALLTDTLAAIALTPRDTSSGVVESAWNAYETSLRNTLVRLRANRLKREGAPFLHPEVAAFASMESQVQEAMSRDPLQMERHLDSLRWRFLDDQLVGHEFDFNTLFVYRIKLLLLEKRLGLDAETGLTRLNEQLQEKLADLDLTAEAAM